MVRKKAADPAAEQQDPRSPLYDPAVHTDPTQVVFVELYCRSGSLWRQRDPVSYLAPMVADWIVLHTGPDHGAVPKADCIAEREARREAAFRVAGRHGDYRPKDHPNLDATCTADRPWPELRNATEG